MSDLIVKNLSVMAGGATLVDSASFSILPGTLTVLLGPNGAGKTSLLRGAMGLIACESDSRTLGGKAIDALSPSQRAQTLAYLPQTRPLAWPNLVRDVVALGRFSHGAQLGRLGKLDAKAVDDALQACDISAFANRRTDSLSGGELARVHCARAFAAQAPLLIADEPVAALDPRHQFRIMDLITDYVRSGGGALVVLHDIALAARYADRLIWMKQGRIMAEGSVDETLTAERLLECYGVRADVTGRDVKLLGPA